MGAIVNAKFSWSRWLPAGRVLVQQGIKKCPNILVMPTIDIGDIDICHAITFYGVSSKGRISRQWTTYKWSVADGVDFCKPWEQLCSSSCERYSKCAKKGEVLSRENRSHFRSLGSLDPNHQVTIGILQNQSSLGYFNCLKFVPWWLTGSPLKIINGSQLL